MAANTATADDVSRRSLRPLSSAETAWLPTALDDAFRRIVVEVPSVAARLDDPDLPDGDPLRQVVVQVQSAMVLRVLANPDGILEESTDDYTRRLDAAVSSGALYLTDGERAYLGEAAGSGGSGGVVTTRAVPVRAYAGRYVPATSTETW